LKADCDNFVGASVGLGAAGGALLITSLILFLATPSSPKPIPLALASITPRKGGAPFRMDFVDILAFR